MDRTRPLVLVGPMGAGKTTVGRRLAQRLGWTFVDLDAEIEQRAQATVAHIFERDGEAVFRALERETLGERLDEARCVIATGGGAVLDTESRRRLREQANVVHLHAGVDAQLRRLDGDATRPLLARGDRTGVLHALAAQRDGLYREAATLSIDTDALAVDAVVESVLASLPGPAAGVTAPHTVEVGGDAAYRISIAPSLRHDGALLTRTLRGRHALIVTDANVGPLYADEVVAALRAAKPGLSIERFVLPPGEHEKTLARFGECIDALARLGATRDASVYALGGGVVGDLAGFAAACWMRGIDVVQLPTTLLAMVDSSVGGKTAVDLPAGKNLVGAFHPPRAVIADTATLRTLPDRELRAGLAEVVKYGAIFDAGFLGWLEEHVDALLARDDAVLAEAIARSCRYKADVVARDPFERGDRALLNFGHTFGHAIETEQGYAGATADGLNHGEAVAVGMVLAARLSARLGLALQADADRLHALLERFGLPVALPPGLAPDALLGRMRLDKKADASGLRLILWEGAGAARIVAGVDEDVVRAVLAAG